MLKFYLITILLLGTASGVATGIAGVVAPILAQIIKKMTGASGLTAMIVAVVASAIVAVAAMFVSGDATSFGDIVKNVSAVFGIATVVYNTFTAATKSPAIP